MSKEELLKYLIAEIDLIMHDKDYRFENANGTWYSRESCRDLTNEEVFEELRTELRQFDDLEAKLAESKKQCQECKHLNKKIELNIKNKLINENQQLKQQLHDLPNKIVEEITNELSNNTSLYFEMRESTSIHCPNKEYEWFNYVRFRNYINTILKKYGDKYE